MVFAALWNSTGVVTLHEGEYGGGSEFATLAPKGVWGVHARRFAHCRAGDVVSRAVPAVTLDAVASDRGILKVWHVDTGVIAPGLLTLQPLCDPFPATEDRHLEAGPPGRRCAGTARG